MGETMGAEGFAWGVLVGSILGPMLCPVIGAMSTDLNWKPTVNLRDPDLKRYILLSLPIMLGVSVVVLDDMIVKRFASLLPGTGSISQLQYARTVMKVPMGVFGMAAGMAAFPTLSRLFAQQRRADAYDTLIQSIRMTMLLAFTAQAALSCVGTEIATVIWGQTRFSPAMLSQIGLLTATYSLGLWAWLIQGLLVWGYYAQGNTWAPIIIGSLFMLLWLPVYSLCSETALALSLASSSIICVYVVVLAWHLLRNRPQESRTSVGLWSALPVLLLSTGIAVYATHWLKSALMLESPVLVSGTLYGCTAIILTLGGCYILGNQEVKLLAQLIQRKLSNRAQNR
jgi:putative peptidoglycan lipid II flippase